MLHKAARAVRFIFRENRKNARPSLQDLFNSQMDVKYWCVHGY